MPQAVVFSCVLGGGHLTLEYDGSGIILIACSPPEEQGGTVMVSWSQGELYLQFREQKLLHALSTKLISYYLN